MQIKLHRHFDIVLKKYWSRLKIEKYLFTNPTLRHSTTFFLSRRKLISYISMIKPIWGKCYLNTKVVLTRSYKHSVIRIRFEFISYGHKPWLVSSVWRLFLQSNIFQENFPYLFFKKKLLIGRSPNCLEFQEMSCLFASSWLSNGTAVCSVF